MNRDAWVELVDAVHARAPLAQSGEHGSHHWRLVCVTGAELIEANRNGADPLVVMLFGLFHDSQRVTDYTDPEHGLRGGDLARELVPRYLELGAERLDILWEACERHTRSGPSDDPTLGTCFDADRLNLWRCGIEPNGLYLSTNEAKNDERIAWAYTLQDHDFSWDEVFDLYVPLFGHVP